MTLNLLLFAITFTIFLEIEFDFIFYVPYRSEEISPSEQSLMKGSKLYRKESYQDGNITGTDCVNGSLVSHRFKMQYDDKHF